MATTQQIFIKKEGNTIIEDVNGDIPALKHTKENGTIYLTVCLGDREDRNFVNRRFNFIIEEYLYNEDNNEYLLRNSGTFVDNSMVVDDSTIVNPATGQILIEGDIAYESGITQYQFMKVALLQTTIYPMIFQGLQNRLGWV